MSIQTGLSGYESARRFNCTASAIFEALKRLGISQNDKKKIVLTLTAAYITTGASSR